MQEIVYTHEKQASNSYIEFLRIIVMIVIIAIIVWLIFGLYNFNNLSSNIIFLQIFGFVSEVMMIDFYYLVATLWLIKKFIKENC